MKVVTAFLLASTFVAFGPASAQSTSATLQDLNGKVLVNKGSGNVSGTSGAALKDGDRIVTLDKSAARIVFSDGCSVNLDENKIFVIDAKLGCKALPIAGAPAPAAGLIASDAVIGAVSFGTVIGTGLIVNNNMDNRTISAQ